MQKNKSISNPKVGMNRSTSSHLLSEGEFSFQKNGNSYDEGGEKFNLTDEHSNILAVNFPEGYKVIGVKNHVVRNKTYIFLTNPETGCSEIGCIENTTEYNFEEDTEEEDNCKDCGGYINKEASPLEEQTQVPHQEYMTLLQDCCSLDEDVNTKCLNFDIEYPIIDIIIKEQNIGTTIFWTDSPGNNELRYLQLDDLGQYIVTGQDDCGAIPEDTCLDCDKLRVFKLHQDLKSESYNRVLGGNLRKGSYEVLGAYCDELGNEFTSYTTLTSIIPIFDESNVIHEQEDNNAETNFAIKVNLRTVDDVFDFYKIAVRYYTSKGVFSSFVEGVHTTTDKTVFITRDTGQSINNNKLSIPKPFIETVDGITASNNILFLNGLREREPFNLQPVINLAGLGMKWMSYRAKEDLYTNADSYQYIGYNRDENVALAVDFGLKDGGRTNLYHFIPRPPTERELEEVIVNDTGINEDINSIIAVVRNCDANDRRYRWQYYNTAGEGVACTNEELETVEQTEITTTYTTVTEDKGLPQIPAGTIIIEDDLESFESLSQYIEENQDNCQNSDLQSICDFLDTDNPLVATPTNPPLTEDGIDCSVPLEDLSEALIEVISVEGETIVDFNKPLEDYTRTRITDTCNIINEEEVDEDFSSQYALDLGNAILDDIEIESDIKVRNNITYADEPNSAITLSPAPTGGTSFTSFIHPYAGAVQPITATTREESYANMQTQYNAMLSTVVEITQDKIGGIPGGSSEYNEGAMFTSKIHKGAIWTKIDVSSGNPLLVEITKLTDNGDSYWRIGNEGLFRADRFKNREIRVHFFHSKNSFSPIETTIYPNVNDITGTSIPLGGILDLTSYPTLIPISSEIVNHSDVRGGFIYMVIDLPLSDSVGLGENRFVDEEPSPTASDIVRTAVTVPLNSCFGVNVREIELARKEISFTKININKLQKWDYECTYTLPLIQDCNPVPYETGELGHYESTEDYPDNEELYNSSKLVINKGFITNDVLRQKIVDNYQESEDNDNIYLSENADFRCKNIRHYKLPDNKISPFINTETLASASESIISPLGFAIDGEVIENMLSVAVDNELISQQQRDNIQDYKIYRSNIDLDRSVVSSGLVYNTKEYTRDDETVEYINYPYNTLGEDKFFEGNTHSDNDSSFTNMQVMSPEFDYFRPSLPDEMSVQGYMFGKSRSRITEVEDHAKMVILGSKARSLANTLAVLETIAEGIINVAQSAEVYRVEVTAIGGSVNPVGIGLNIAAIALQALGSVVYKVGRYRLEWLQSFENLGTPYNFGYYLTSVGNYNNLKTLQEEGDLVRGLSLKSYLDQGQIELADPTNGKAIRINNIDREGGAFFTLGDYAIDVPESYKNYDNNDINSNSSSQMISSEIGSQVGKSPEKIRNIASPYVAFKNYIPNQYGNIGSISWVDTGYCFDIETRGECEGILGGDTFITGHSKKRKTRLFDTDLLGSADLTPFPYKFYGTYGDPTYYIDYKVNSEFDSSGEVFPDIEYDVQFDGSSSTNSFYVEPPSKFYLYTTSFPTFLCETRINTNFRNARTEPWNQFYPQNSDYERITQPNLVSLTQPENFFYNRAYLQTSVLNTNNTLPEYYSAEDEARKAYNTNTIQYSLPDVNENSITEPWLLYRPNDRVTLESTYGNLINLKGIESDQLLMFYEDALQLQNSVNTFTDGQTQYNTDLGNGGIFAKRALTLRHTDLGYGGSQTKHTLSCEFGHFYVDTKRGQIFKFTGGNDLQEISRYTKGAKSSNMPNGMDVWFKEHLPIKFKKQFPTFEQTNNPYNGIGIHWGYDSKYRRVILTKKDYVKAEGVDITYDLELNEFSNGLTLQENITEGNFKDISWTITFKPETGSWESYMSYVPNYYISHTNYFQSGINSEDTENGLWSHLLSNKSYRVFYGQKYPYVIEYPVKNEYFSKRLESIDWNAQLRRYHNEYDFAPIETNPFTSVTIFNDYENSGELIPVKNTGALSQLSKYPITNKNNTQDVLLSYDNYRYTMNYFFNRVKSNKNNQPIWQWDENQIEKSINDKAVSFYGKKSLERLKGNFFTVRLERDGNTNYDLDFRWSEQVTKGIQ